MIVVRDIFQLKFGQIRKVKELFKEGIAIFKQSGYVPDRILTDFTGDFYTLVMESSFNSLTDYEKTLHNELNQQEWRQWYEKFIPFVESGCREILSIVDMN